MTLLRTFLITISNLMYRCLEENILKYTWAWILALLCIAE